MNDMERYVMGMALTNGHAYGPPEGETMIECDYCGAETKAVFTCMVCGDEYCALCSMQGGPDCPCDACREGSPCDVDDDVEPDWGGSWGDQT